jgi:uncharacterized DUF497 family protein
MFSFEFDEQKSRRNLEKHGIDFVRGSAVITHRSANIRIISVRRSRSEEVALYEG